MTQTTLEERRTRLLAQLEQRATIPALLAAGKPVPNIPALADLEAALAEVDAQLKAAGDLSEADKRKVREVEQAQKRAAALADAKTIYKQLLALCDALDDGSKKHAREPFGIFTRERASSLRRWVNDIRHGSPEVAGIERPTMAEREKAEQQGKVRDSKRALHELEKNGRREGDQDYDKRVDATRAAIKNYEHELRAYA